jgi:hypothetical protein
MSYLRANRFCLIAVVVRSKLDVHPISSSTYFTIEGGMFVVLEF